MSLSTLYQLISSEIMSLLTYCLFLSSSSTRNLPASNLPALQVSTDPSVPQEVLRCLLSCKQAFWSGDISALAA